MSAQNLPDQTILGRTKWITSFCAFVLLAGTTSRLAPLLEPYGRLLQQFMTEDGYLMQTVARNWAMGLGLSVSDGTTQTNGVQPLATFLFGFSYIFSGGDRVEGIGGVLLMSVVISLAAAGLLYLLSRKVLKGLPDEQPLALIIAALWFASPLVVKQSMNGLETGLYFLMTLFVLNVSANLFQKNDCRLTLPQMLGQGCLFGVCFLTRNDAVFLIAAAMLARFFLLWPRGASALWDRIVEMSIPGLVSLAIALPWLIYNYRLFGSIVPISGIAESLDARFGENLLRAPAKLFEYLTMIILIPDRFEEKAPTVAACMVAVVTALIIAVRSQSRCGRYVALSYILFGGFLIAFYGLFFGAQWFMSRYLSILSPFLTLVGVLAGYRLLLLVSRDIHRGAVLTSAVIMVIAVLTLNGIIYRDGARHDHFQVVDWVNEHLSKETWVGAVQTGTLGFFHDKTINLDGKVNPDALRARLSTGDVLGYVVASKISYLVDWAGIGSWAQISKDDFNRHFELVLLDHERNLSVLRRTRNIQ